MISHVRGGGMGSYSTVVVLSCCSISSLVHVERFLFASLCASGSLAMSMSTVSHPSNPMSF